MYPTQNKKRISIPIPPHTMKQQLLGEINQKANPLHTGTKEKSTKAKTLMRNYAQSLPVSIVPKHTRTR
jgi:hypothetical protein